MKSLDLVIVVIFTILSHPSTYHSQTEGGVSNLGKPCQQCPPGTHVDKPCSPSKPTVCMRCEPGRFNHVWNTLLACRPCTKYCEGPNEIPIKRCSILHDLVCGCPKGYWHFRPNHTDSKCIPYMLCGVGYGVDIPGTILDDVKCTKCVKGYNFSGFESYSAPCQNCTNCEESGVRELEPCTVSKDTMCEVTTPKIKPTTPTATTTTRKTSTPSTTTKKPDETSVGMKPVQIVVTVSVILVACAAAGTIIGILIYRHKTKAKQKDKRDTKEKDSQGVPISDSLLGDPDHDVVQVYNAAGGVVGYSRSGMRRRLSSTQIPYISYSLKENIQISDVITYVGRNFGLNGHKTFLLSLPGHTSTQGEEGRLTNAEYDDIWYRHKVDIIDIITEGIFKWKEKNPEMTHGDILSHLHRQMSIHNRQDLASRLVEKYGIKEESDTDESS